MQSSDNPYQATAVDLTTGTPTGERDQTSVFSPKGRFTRMSYIAWTVTFAWLITLLVAVIAGAVAGGVGAGPAVTDAIGVVVSLPMMVIGVIFAIRRLHDMDASGWWTLLYVIPLVNMILILVLLLKSGTEGANDRGPERPTTSGERVAGIVGLVIMIAVPVVVIVAIAIPAYNAYLQEAMLQQGG